MTRTFRALLLATGVFAGASRSQLLDLTPPPPLPSFAELGMVEPALASVQLEIERLTLARTAASQRQQAAVDAMLALRLLAAAELQGLSGTDPVPWLELDRALRLVEGLPTLDASIRAILVRADRDQLRGLAAFAAAVRAPAATEHAARRRAALCSLLETLDSQALPESSWPREVGQETAASRAAPATIDALRARLAAIERLPAARGAIGNLLDAATELRGADAAGEMSDTAAFLGLRRRMAAAQLIDLLEVVDKSSLLDRSKRDAFESHLADLATALAGSRMEGSDRDAEARAWSAAREAAATAAVLNSAEAARPSLGADSKALASLPMLLLRLDTDASPRDAPPPWRAKQAVAAALDAMASSRATDPQVRGPALVDARKSLVVELRKTEQALVEALSSVLESPSLLSDPAMATLLRSQQRLAEDLRWLGTLPEIAKRLAGSGGATAGAGTADLERSLLERLTTIAQGLADHARRPDALQARGQLERQMRHFLELPGEHPTKRERMAALLGQERWAQVQQAIDAARREWVAAWAGGETGGAAARRLLDLLRRLRGAEALAILQDDRGFEAVAATLDRWNGWSIPTATLRALMESSSTAAEPEEGGRDGVDAERRLRAVERATALPRLALVLSERLQPAVGTSTSPAAAVLAPLCADPPVDAWGREDLEALARLAVLGRAAAAVVDESEKGRALREALDQEANALLQQLGEWRGPIPTVRF